MDPAHGVKCQWLKDKWNFGGILVYSAQHKLETGRFLPACQQVWDSQITERKLEKIKRSGEN